MFVKTEILKNNRVGLQDLESDSWRLKVIVTGDVGEGGGIIKRNTLLVNRFQLSWNNRHYSGGESYIK